MSAWQRARGADQKRERREAILAAAWEIFQQLPFQTITMAQVAQRLGLSKGTLYLYFKTKEELFLAVQLEQLETWIYGLEADLAAWNGTGDTAGVLRVICDSVSGRLPIIRFMALLEGILEHNVAVESAMEFRRRMALRLSAIGSRLEVCLPYLRPGEGARFALHTQALMVGMLQHANPSPAVKRMLQTPGLEALNIDYLTEVTEVMELLLFGLASRRGAPMPKGAPA
ncbi:Fatty acid metabolism regulator protein [compost metagenome]